MRRWRKMTWLILGWTAVIGLWLYSAFKQGNAAEACRNSVDHQSCMASYHIGSGAAYGFIVLVWLVGFIILSILWFMTGPGRRDRRG